MKKRLAKGLRKFIRQEKARIKRGTSNLSEQKQKIKELYK